ncbi:MAG: MarC family protein [Simkania sp.]|nr:MarC family protein [Simkania sp.]
MPSSFSAIAISLFLVLNSIGCIPFFIGLLSNSTPKRQRQIVLREMLIALSILLVFTFFGNEILSLLGISEAIIGIGGGLLLFIIALGMIFPKTEEPHAPKQEPMIIPLAVPLIAGPGTISAVMVYAEHSQRPILVAAALICAWIVSLAVLLLSSNIKYCLGEKALTAFAKFGGMLLTLISVQMFTQGLISLIKQNFC